MCAQALPEVFHLLWCWSGGGGGVVTLMLPEVRSRLRWWSVGGWRHHAHACVLVACCIRHVKKIVSFLQPHREGAKIREGEQGGGTSCNGDWRSVWWENFRFQGGFRDCSGCGSVAGCCGYHLCTEAFRSVLLTLLILTSLLLSLCHRPYSRHDAPTGLTVAPASLRCDLACVCTCVLWLSRWWTARGLRF